MFPVNEPDASQNGQGLDFEELYLGESELEYQFEARDVLWCLSTSLTDIEFMV